LRDGFEAFLPGGVPDLQFDGAASGLEGPDFEVDSDGGEEAAWGGADLSLKMLSEKRSSMLDLPTEELPISISLNR
jgi:hypothetical protein